MKINIVNLSNNKGMNYSAKINREFILDSYKSQNLIISLGSYNINSHEICLYGNSDNLHEVIKTLNHEIYHQIIFETLESFGYNKHGNFVHNLKHEYIVHQLTDKKTLKCQKRMSVFIHKLWIKLGEK